MYLFLGNETVVKIDEIIGIFDLDNTSNSKITRDFLSLSEKKGRVLNVTYELPKSFVITAEKRTRFKNNEESFDSEQKGSKYKKKRLVGKRRYSESSLFISQLSSSTLEKRLKDNYNF